MHANLTGGHPSESIEVLLNPSKDWGKYPPHIHLEQAEMMKIQQNASTYFNVPLNLQSFDDVSKKNMDVKFLIPLLKLYVVLNQK